jgi:hypothetical protein
VILPLPAIHDTLYFAPNKTLTGITPQFWLYSWKGLVYLLLDRKNANRLIDGKEYVPIFRFEEDPSEHVLLEKIRML